jgi:putative multiple sugar transport system permease protein
VAGFLVSRLRQIGIFIALIAIVVLFQILTDGTLLEPRNVTSIVVQNAYILILAIGMVMIIIAGHIDLSVGSVVALVGAVSGVFAVNWGWPWWGSPRSS